SKERFGRRGVGRQVQGRGIAEAHAVAVIQGRAPVPSRARAPVPEAGDADRNARRGQGGGVHGGGARVSGGGGPRAGGQRGARPQIEEDLAQTPAAGHPRRRRAGRARQGHHFRRRCHPAHPQAAPREEQEAGRL
ncbi:hypothetical protein IWQ56_005337, partial [Coemansia nantahalensis]